MRNGERNGPARSGPTGSLLLLGAALAACGPSALAPTDAGPADSPASDAASSDDAAFVLRPVALETVAPEGAVAGQPLAVQCLLVDANGEAFPMPDGFAPAVRFAPSASVTSRDGVHTPTRAGALEATCVDSALALVDPTPARVVVRAGPAAVVYARVAQATVTAGASVDVRCEAFDAFGNPVESGLDAATLAAAPSQAGNELAERAARFTRAGVYDLTCVLAGASAEPTRLEVTAAEPAELTLTRAPDQPVYARDQIVEARARVTDRYGNEVPDAPVSITSAPAGAMLGDGRFRYAADGTYTVTARVGSASCAGAGSPLCKTATIVVDSDGPAIVCGPNANGAGAWDATARAGAAGATLALVGRVADSSGVTSVRVNDRAVPLEAGAFTLSLAPRAGVNFVEVTATDARGRENTRTCSLLYGTRYLPEASLMTDAVALQLRMPAIDDGDPIAPISSLDDAVQTVLNSAGLRNAVHAALLASNPLKPSSCDSSVAGVCIFRSEITYLDTQLSGTRTSTLALVAGGLRVTLAIPLLRVRVQVRGTLDTTGWVNFENVTAAATFDLSLSSARRPQVRVRAGTVTSNVARVNPDFPGLSGVLIDVVASLAQNRLRGLVSTALRDYVATDLNGQLDALVGGLRIDTLGSTFNVPRIEGSGAVRLDFGVDFSSVSATAARLLVGVGTRLSTPTVTRATATPGVWQPPGTTYLLDPVNTQPAAVALHTGVLNQALHALWRGGWFDARVANASLGAGVVAVVRAPLPPITQPRAGGALALELAALDVDLTVPNVFDPPLRVRLGAVASTRVALRGDALAFEPVTIDELHLTLPCQAGGCQPLSAANRAQLEMLLRRVLQQLADRSLATALPAIPLPSFPIPASLVAFGLPAGRSLGVLAPALALEGQHYVLRARFGVR